MTGIRSHTVIDRCSWTTASSIKLLLISAGTRKQDVSLSHIVEGHLVSRQSQTLNDVCQRDVLLGSDVTCTSLMTCFRVPAEINFCRF